jgi:hypothetical protein
MNINPSAYSLVTFQGYEAGDKTEPFDALEPAIWAFIHSDESRLPRLLNGEQTIIFLDAENAHLPEFLGDDAGHVSSVYDHVEASKHRPDIKHAKNNGQ